MIIAKLLILYEACPKGIRHTCVEEAHEECPVVREPWYVQTLMQINMVSDLVAVLCMFVQMQTIFCLDGCYLLVWVYKAV